MNGFDYSNEVTGSEAVELATASGLGLWAGVVRMRPPTANPRTASRVAELKAERSHAAGRGLAREVGAVRGRRQVQRLRRRLAGEHQR